MAVFKIKYSGDKSPPIGSLEETIANKLMKISPSNMKIGTWNARSLLAPGKLDNIVLEMVKLNVDIQGVSDVRWSGNGTFYYSGNNDPRHLYGVGVILDMKITGSVLILHLTQTES